jgi:hypothetical protein
VDFQSLTFEDVGAKAEEIDRRYREEAARVGVAATLQGTEDDDWLKLHTLMRTLGARRVQDLGAEEAQRWAERMARHAAE